MRCFVLLSAAVLASSAWCDGPEGGLRLTARSAVVVAAEESSPVAKFAARELRDFLSKTFGAEVELTDHLPAEPDKVAIIVGTNRWSEAEGVDVSGLVRDESVIRIVRNRIWIAGRDDAQRDPEKLIAKVGGVATHHYERATLFGVYGFLEKYAGCRLYFPGRLGTVLQPTSELVLPIGEERSRPDFERRSVLNWYDGFWFDGPETRKTGPGKVLNMYRLRLETFQVPCCHGSRKFGYIERYAKSHPEYFALGRDGRRSIDPKDPFGCQLCWSSEITERMYEDARAYLQGKVPAFGNNCVARRYVDVMPQDGYVGCLCDRCQAAYCLGDRNFATELIWGKVAEIAGRLKRDGVNGKLCMMAYVPYQRIPAFDIPDNVDVMVSVPGPWSEGCPDRQRKDDALVRDWSAKVRGKVWLWTYPNKFPGGTLEMKGVPQMTPHAYGRYYRRIAPLVSGAFVESESDRFIFNYLNYYVFSHVAWNAKTDVDALLREHHRLMFGAAAAEMEKVYELLERKWIREVAGRISDSPRGPVAAPPSEYVLWNEVYSEQVLKGIGKLFDSAAAKVGPGSVEAERIAFFRREFLGRLTEARNASCANADALRGLEYRMTDFNGDVLKLVPHRHRMGSSDELVDTEVKVWRTDLHLQVAFRCKEPYLDRVSTATRAPDDPELWKDNSVEIFLNPSGDRANCIHLTVNSDGVLADRRVTVSGRTETSSDQRWHSEALVRIQRGFQSWTATVSIPLARIGESADRMPANFCRNRVLTGGFGYQVHYQWSPSAARFSDAEHWGTLIDSRPRIQKETR